MADFESIWRERVRRALQIHGCGHLWEALSSISIEDSTAFTESLLKALTAHGGGCAADVLSDCACHASHDDLIELCDLWRQTHDLALVHSRLQEHFIQFIRVYKELNDEQVNDLTASGWGMAGTLEGNTITATKIPAMYHESFTADDPDEKRYCYCHCPRIKERLRRGESIDPMYCHCGMGFYLDIWAFILERPVRGEIIASILRGDPVCSFRLDLNL